MAKTATLYDELGVSARATDVEIRRAYRNLVTKTHPDRGGDPAAFKRIQQAYEILSDAKKVRLHVSMSAQCCSFASQPPWCEA